MKKNNQYILACSLITFGCGLLLAGFLIAPTGEIHASVLVAFGEVMTFAGALIGIDYVYKTKDKG